MGQTDLAFQYERDSNLLLEIAWLDCHWTRSKSAGKASETRIWVPKSLNQAPATDLASCVKILPHISRLTITLPKPGMLFMSQSFHIRDQVYGRLVQIWHQRYDGAWVLPDK